MTTWASVDEGNKSPTPFHVSLNTSHNVAAHLTNLKPNQISRHSTFLSLTTKILTEKLTKHHFNGKNKLSMWRNQKNTHQNLSFYGGKTNKANISHDIFDQQYQSKNPNKHD